MEICEACGEIVPCHCQPVIAHPLQQWTTATSELDCAHCDERIYVGDRMRHATGYGELCEGCGETAERETQDLKGDRLLRALRAGVMDEPDDPEVISVRPGETPKSITTLHLPGDDQ